MKRSLLLITATCLLASARYAHSDPWSPTSKALAVSAATATALDWAQTRYIAQHPQTYYETNPLLGRHPTVGDVNRYFVGSFILGGAIANYLNDRHRRWFLGAVTFIEIGFIGHNRSIGIGFSF